MTLVRSAGFSGSCFALRSGGNWGREEGGSFLIWYDFDVVVLWVFLFRLLTPWFVASNRSIPDCPSLRRPHVSFFFFFFFESIRLISLRLCGGLEPLMEHSLGAVDPLENQLHTDCVRPGLAV